MRFIKDGIVIGGRIHRRTLSTWDQFVSLSGGFVVRPQASYLFAISRLRRQTPPQKGNKPLRKSSRRKLPTAKPEDGGLNFCTVNTQLTVDTGIGKSGRPVSPISVKSLSVSQHKRCRRLSQASVPSVHSYVEVYSFMWSRLMLGGVCLCENVPYTHSGGRVCEWAPGNLYR